MLRHCLDDLQPDEPSVARFLIRLIPPQCPLKRDVTIVGRKLLHIPPMCRINPLDEDLNGPAFPGLVFP
ncbi:Mo-dependent nitrogenase C-terminal domain-containing protein [Synechococcus sp. CBW1107]|uniref:Mo-dependent nitrogenase C-terminal domain-containing protein n=1 Tax=Synechococcus sp. CBW1107 TaxID=2789857 RepID=UPI003A10192D